jgi:hypothetical protein
MLLKDTGMFAAGSADVSYSTPETHPALRLHVPPMTCWNGTALWLTLAALKAELATLHSLEEPGERLPPKLKPSTIWIFGVPHPDLTGKPGNLHTGIVVSAVSAICARERPRCVR